ncbi:Imm5 family immunity protein [Chitinophaga sp. RAB17]|uniref:Imm5 family immunity protein n=1 Tax=Chitinophaga sp. RAB17 TaxID=3233049 RepID=UPI003F8F2764
MLSNIIEQERINLSTYPDGHLPLAKRVRIAGEIKDPETINKIFLACCKFAFTKLHINDNLLLDILKKAGRTLYEKEINDFGLIYEQNKNYLESMDKWPLSGVAMACLSLCRSLDTGSAGILNMEEYEGQDDNIYDWEDWNADFFASNAYSGGNPFLNEGSIQKRIEFWDYYLETALKIYRSPDRIADSEVKGGIAESTDIIRSKDYNDSFLHSKIKEVIDLVLQDLKESKAGSDWIRIEIEGQDIGGMGMKGFYFSNDNERNRFELTYYLYDGDLSAVKLMDKVKKHIYEQSPNEGTWFSYLLTIYPDQTYSVAYNFDDPKIFSDKAPNLEPFVGEFKKYPRLQDFTPQWWQDIIKNQGLQYRSL